jgi:hypothetical protein
MSKWTYYSPTLAGTLLAILITLQATPGWAWPLRLAIALGAVLIGSILAMLLMVACQGLLVGVMPAGRGKSIRGRGPTFVGAFFILAFVLGVPCALFASEGIGPVALTLGGVALAFIIFALAIYLWSLPAAKTDFKDPNLRHHAPTETG